MFVGCNSTGASTTNMEIQEALEASLQNKNLGCQRIIVLTVSKNFERICNKKKIPHWREQALLTDLQFLRQQEMTFCFIAIPKPILNDVVDITSLATKMPIHHCRVQPTIL